MNLLIQICETGSWTNIYNLKVKLEAPAPRNRLRDLYLCSNNAKSPNMCLRKLAVAADDTVPANRHAPLPSLFPPGKKIFIILRSSQKEREPDLAGILYACDAAYLKSCLPPPSVRDANEAASATHGLTLIAVSLRRWQVLAPCKDEGNKTCQQEHYTLRLQRLVKNP